VESLVERRAISDPTVAAGVVRFSTGIEDAEDLLEDLAMAGSGVLA
jgi:cystathionine beta-lyase/cystathionine gamma-synthase